MSENDDHGRSDDELVDAGQPAMENRSIAEYGKR
jgi:hypothetical protein